MALPFIADLLQLVFGQQSFEVLLQVPTILVTDERQQFFVGGSPRVREVRGKRPSRASDSHRMRLHRFHRYGGEVAQKLRPVETQFLATDLMIRDQILHGPIAWRVKSVEQLHLQARLHRLDQRVADDVDQPPKQIGELGLTGRKQVNRVLHRHRGIVAQMVPRNRMLSLGNGPSEDEMRSTVEPFVNLARPILVVFERQLPLFDRSARQRTFCDRDRPVTNFFTGIDTDRFGQSLNVASQIRPAQITRPLPLQERRNPRMRASQFLLGQHGID